MKLNLKKTLPMDLLFCQLLTEIAQQGITLSLAKCQSHKTRSAQYLTDKELQRNFEVTENSENI